VRAGPGQRNPVNRLNIGVVSVKGEADGASIRFEILTCDEGAPGAARVAYDSGWL
jgi:hypothetical protein